VRLAALPKSRFGKAAGYLKNQWVALRRYLDDPRLPIDNDQAEQTIRPLTVGRRNWLFLGHPQAAPGRMQLLSIVSSAQRHHLVMEEYLSDVLRQLADANQHRPEDLELNSPYLRNLLPDPWAEQHPQSIRRASKRIRHVPKPSLPAARYAAKKNVARNRRTARALCPLSRNPPTPRLLGRRRYCGCRALTPRRGSELRILSRNVLEAP
jgi:hypothetical protein